MLSSDYGVAMRYFRVLACFALTNLVMMLHHYKFRLFITIPVPPVTQGLSLLENFGVTKLYFLRFDDVAMFTQP